LAEAARSGSCRHAKGHGALPASEKRCPLDVRIDEEVDCGSYVAALPAMLRSQIPRARHLLIRRRCSRSTRPPRAILALHPTTRLAKDRGWIGERDQMTPTGSSWSSAVRRAGAAYPLLANYHPNLKLLGYQSGTMKGLWDNMRGLDLLVSLPFVKTNGFGAIGHRWAAQFSLPAVFDERSTSSSPVADSIPISTT